MSFQAIVLTSYSLGFQFEMCSKWRSPVDLIFLSLPYCQRYFLSVGLSFCFSIIINILHNKQQQLQFIHIYLFNLQLYMFCKIVDKEYVFDKPEKARLILAIPLCAKTIIFFCDNLVFYHYSLIDHKILYQSKLPGRPIQAIAYSGHQILCTILEHRDLMLLDIRERSFHHVSKLPLTKIHFQSRIRDTFTQSRLVNFQKSNCFYIEQPCVEQQQTHIYFYEKPVTDPIEDQPNKIQGFQHIGLSTRKNIIKKFDHFDKLSYFNQEIQDNGSFKFTIISCANTFSQKEISLQNKNFTRFAIIKEIVSISSHKNEQRFLIFINSCPPVILLVVEDQVDDFPYQANKNFLSTILINISAGYGLFTFMPTAEQPDPNCQEILELIQLKGGKVHERLKCRNISQICKSWEDDYLMMYRREMNPSQTSSFNSKYIIDKQGIYMKMLWDKGFEELSSSFMQQILSNF